MTIEVTAEDILEGKRHSCRRCPIALALMRHGFDHIPVGPFSGHSYQFCMSWQPFLASYIRHFDGPSEVEPFTFELDATP